MQYDDGDEGNHRIVAVNENYTFTVVLEPHEGGFLVHVPALPEVVTEEKRKRKPSQWRGTRLLLFWRAGESGRKRFP